jgi:hypothetical protein
MHGLRAIVAPSVFERAHVHHAAALFLLYITLYP